MGTIPKMSFDEDKLGDQGSSGNRAAQAADEAGAAVSGDVNANAGTNQSEDVNVNAGTNQSGDVNANAGAGAGKGAKKAKDFDNPDNPMVKAAGGAIHAAGAFGGLAYLIGGLAVKAILTGASAVIAPAYILRDLTNRRDPGDSAKQGVPKLNTDKITKMHDQESDNRKMHDQESDNRKMHDQESDNRKK